MNQNVSVKVKNIVIKEMKTKWLKWVVRNLWDNYGGQKWHRNEGPMSWLSDLYGVYVGLPDISRDGSVRFVL